MGSSLKHHWLPARRRVPGAGPPSRNGDTRTQSYLAYLRYYGFPLSFTLLVGGFCAAASESQPQWTSYEASAIEWREPYATAQMEAQRTGKTMLLFFSESACAFCRKFETEVLEQKEFEDFAKDHLICCRIDYGSTASVEARRDYPKLAETQFNVPHAHVVVIATAEGIRIGELSTVVTSVRKFIDDINIFIAKAPSQGRMKFCELELLDKHFTPDRTFSTPPPVFSPEPLKGRYINFMSAIRVDPWENTRARLHGQYPERGRHTVEAALLLRNALADGFPGASMTWAWSWGALNEDSPNFLQLRTLMRNFNEKYGDEVTFWPGVYYINKFNTSEQAKKDLHEGLGLVSKMIGNDYRPRSVIAGTASVESMKYLAEEEGIHVIQGQMWSQYDIDGEDGDGGIIYPYYPSTTHFLKPAQGPRGSEDFVDMVNVDGWTVDFFAARLRGMDENYNSRVGIGPIETRARYGMELGHKEMLHVTEVHFSEEAVRKNGYGFLTANWELPLFDHWMEPEYLSGWLKAIRAKYPDVRMMNLGEFGELWRSHNPDNGRIDLRFIERPNQMPLPEAGLKIHPGYQYDSGIFNLDEEIRWFFNRDFRLAMTLDLKTDAWRVMDYTRYDLPYHEPEGNVIERHWDLLGLINQKQGRPQDRPQPFAALPEGDRRRILARYPELAH